MSYTLLADLINANPQLQEMVAAELKYKSVLVSSGLALPTYQGISVDKNLNGTTIEVPKFTELTGAEAIMAEGATVAVDKIGTFKDIAVICNRTKAFGIEKLSEWVAHGGDKALKEIVSQVSSYVAQRIDVAGLNALKGVFANSAVISSHVNDVAVSTGTAIPVTTENTLDTMLKLGENMEELSLMIMHSKVFADLLKIGVAQWEAGGSDSSPKTAKFGTFLGKRVIVSDNVPVDTTTPSYYEHQSYIAKPGAMWIGMNREVEITPFHNELQHQKGILLDWSFVAHVRNVKWSGTPAGQSPTNTELATGTNWTKIAPTASQLPIVTLNSN